MSAYTTHPIELPRLASLQDRTSNATFRHAGEECGQARVDARGTTFDPDWYRARYPGCTSHRNPVEHYLEQGWLLGHDPNPYFSTRDYLAANADVAASGINPFLHYVLYGANQGRSPRSDG